ncbi:MAG: hypothetical protein KF893_22560 [Caldilineaceae bacterium]|nr:hypothetical protein [Caldilineaceae bacterium]
MMNQQSHERSQQRWRTVLLYLACYVLWFTYSALSLWTILQYRDAILGLLPIIGPWVMGAVDKFGFLFLGLLALIWVLYLEHYLRTGVEEHKLWSRALRVAIIQLVVLGIAEGLKLLTAFWLYG